MAAELHPIASGHLSSTPTRRVPSPITSLGSQLMSRFSFHSGCTLRPTGVDVGVGRGTVGSGVGVCSMVRGRVGVTMGLSVTVGSSSAEGVGVSGVTVASGDGMTVGVIMRVGSAVGVADGAVPTMVGVPPGDTVGVSPRSGVATGAVSEVGVIVGVEVAMGLSGPSAPTVGVSVGILVGPGLTTTWGVVGTMVRAGSVRPSWVVFAMAPPVPTGPGEANGTAIGTTMMFEGMTSTEVGTGVGPGPPQATAVARSSNRDTPNVLINALGPWERRNLCIS